MTYYFRSYGPLYSRVSVTEVHVFHLSSSTPFPVLLSCPFAALGTPFWVLLPFACVIPCPVSATAPLPTLHQSQKNFTKNTYSSPITKNFTSPITKKKIIIIRTSPMIPTLHQSQKNFTKNTYSSPITKKLHFTNHKKKKKKKNTKDTYSSPVIHKASLGRPFVSLMNKANAFLLFFLQGPSYYLKEYTQHLCQLNSFHILKHSHWSVLPSNCLLQIVF